MNAAAKTLSLLAISFFIAQSTVFAVDDAENTQINQRDTQPGAVTPETQGNSEADVNMTAKIRRQLTDHKNLSVNAKNIKIITLEGHVTLRGPVNSTKEKAAIEKIANSVAGAARVHNRIQITQ